MYLVDTNVIMYAAGAPHPNKEPSVGVLRRIADGEIDATINAESLQEILHRYRAIRRWNDGHVPRQGCEPRECSSPMAWLPPSSSTDWEG